MLNRDLMCEILEQKLEEGYDIVRSKKIDDKDFGTTVVNMFEIEKTIKDLHDKTAFDKEMKENYEKQDEIKKALSKNKEVEVIR